MGRLWTGTLGTRLALYGLTAIALAAVGAQAMGVPWYRGALIGALVAGIGGLAIWQQLIVPLRRLAARSTATTDAEGATSLPATEIDRIARHLDALSAAVAARDALLRDAEETIRNNEVRYRDLFDRNPHPMIVFDVETLEILAANDAATARYGYSRSQFLRLTIRHLLPEPVTFGNTVVLARMAVDEEQPREDVHRRRDGTLIDVEVASRRMRFAGRSAAVALLSDITLRKQAQERARRHTEMLASLSDAAREQASSLRPADVAHAVVRAATGRFGGCAAWIGVRTRPDALEVLAVMPVGADTAPQPVAVSEDGPTQQAMSENRRVVYTIDADHVLEGPWTNGMPDADCTEGVVLPLVTHDQAYGVLHVLGARSWQSNPELLAGLEGLALHASAALANALAHEQLRAQANVLEQRVRERTAELQAANRELEAFSYSVSHDLRAPLRSIEGFSRLLLNEHGRDLPEGALRYLSFIRCAVTEMDELIRGLLAFARASRQPLHLTHVDPQELVDSVLRSLRHEIGTRQVEFRIGDLPPCQGDRVLLRQVFANLLSNAVKYSAHCEHAVVEVGARTESGETVYYVKDNGVGFDPSQGDKVFQVFQRLHSSDEYPGSGVGLATVHRILTRHGGRIWYETAPNQGATFFFSLGTLHMEPSGVS